MLIPQKGVNVSLDTWALANERHGSGRSVKYSLNKDFTDESNIFNQILENLSH